MARTRRISVEEPTRRSRPASTPEARINQLVNKAYNIAEKQMEEGTVSSQVLTQFLKMGTAIEEAKLERLKYENELIKAKTEAIRSSKNMEVLYENAIKAMKSYSAVGGDDEYDEYDYED